VSGIGRDQRRFRSSDRNALLAWENGTHSISLYMVCLSAITLVAVFAARETALREL
jgi:hypothetical protein